MNWISVSQNGTLFAFAFWSCSFGSLVGTYCLVEEARKKIGHPHRKDSFFPSCGGWLNSRFECARMPEREKKLLTVEYLKEP